MLNSSCLFFGGWALPDTVGRSVLAMSSRKLPRLSSPAVSETETNGMGRTPPIPGWDTSRTGEEETSGSSTVFDYGFFSGSSGKFRLPGEADLAASICGKEPMRPLLLLGHSMGAPLALSLAEAFPDSVSGVILFTPFVRFVKDGDFPGWDKESLEEMKTNLLRNPGSLLRAFYRRCAAPERFMLPLNPPESWNLEALVQGLDYLMGCDVRGVRVRCPVLCLLSGEGDSIVSAAMQRAAAEELSSRGRNPVRVEVLETAGHLLPATRTERCADLVSAFIMENADGK